MADCPIIFSAPMIQTLLEGRKTQVRRIIKPQPCECGGRWMITDRYSGECYLDDWVADRASCHQYQPGDRFWVQESHYLTDDGDNEYAVFAADTESTRDHLAQIASLKERHSTVNWSHHERLHSPIQLPRWASRLTLRVTSVKVERLQVISVDDVTAEGIITAPNSAIDFATMQPVPGFSMPNGGFSNLPGAHKVAYRQLWENLNGEGSWAANPWVYALGFEVIKANIDSAELVRD